MGVDGHMMVEISHHDEPWRPLAGSAHLYTAKREQAVFALIGDVTNSKGRFSDGWQEPRTLPDGKKVPGFWYRPDIGDHEPLIPICEPRGVPADASKEWLGHVAHFAVQREKIVTTYFDPDEVVNADWDQQVFRRAILFEKDYLALAHDGTIPTRWMHDVGGEDVRVVDEFEYSDGVRGERETFVHARWNAGTIRSLSGGMPDMLAEILSVKPPTSRMRLMFLFEA